MMNKNFSFTLHADGINLTNGIGENGTNAITYINNLYNTATKTAVTTAGGEAITQAQTVGLMQDSFENIRYYGADPDNYVTFNGETSGWRIIGVFDVEDENGNVSKRVKLIRNTSIGLYSFDNKPSGVGSSTIVYGSNDWRDARLMMLLNPGYETPSSLYAYEGSLYWNKKSGTCYAGENQGTKSCDFTTTGLTDKGKIMIGQAKYYLGGSSSYLELYADDYYNFERAAGSNTWTGYVGIMYPSDYAYATDLSECKKDGYNYSTHGKCINTDWLLDNSTLAWTITPFNPYKYHIFRINNSGTINGGYYVNQITSVRPVVYLTPQIGIVSGSGDANDPFVLG